jgi:crotonobetainyl-CoA:carnitine CoA-transferase CaiB-like acyl-CoA transferase
MCWPTTCALQAMQRLGLGYEALAAVNPRLIYAGMFGFSQRGRYAAQAAFDDLIQAGSALLAVAVANGAGQCIPRYLPVTIADRSVGLYAFGVIARRCTRGSADGTWVSGSTFRCSRPWCRRCWATICMGQTFVPAKGDFGYPRLLSPERRPYATKRRLTSAA